ncbi:MAG: hypothetical protein IT480_06525 [Gammaproteobacteria bacterium]|nr:hypothetical protein [Gammaproteobacteria bacterium]
MARPKQPVSEPEGEDSPAAKARASQRDLLERVRTCHQKLVDAPSEREMRAQAMSDMKFLHVPGEQWDATQKRRRGKRPCYEFNLTSVRAMRVINDMRANRAYGKVRAFEDGDKDTADVFEGLIRNICNASNFDALQDYAAGYQVGGGMGAWRVETDYADDSTFEQDIRISRVMNPFALYLTEDEAIFVDRISRAEYERRWPKAERVDFEASEFDDDSDWDDEQSVRVCEYWYKTPATIELALLADGRTVDLADPLPDGAEILQRRKVRTQKIRMCIASGSALLEEADWAGKFIPFVQVFGQWVLIDGKVHWYGLVRAGKDAQRSYNVAHTAVVETIASAPQAKFWATPAQAEGHVAKWSTAHDENLPFMLYNADPKAGGTPQRMGGADVPVALIQQLTIAEQALNGVLGIHEASLGQQGDEKSGRAITARQAQGELATFNFKANMAEGVRKTWEILIDLIPKIYTAERSIRILGVDGAEKFVKINGVETDPRTLQMRPVNDLSRGKYDVAITVGPSFSTQRQETLEVMMQLAQGNPQIWAVAGDIIATMLDSPKSEQLAERLRSLLPPQIQQQLAQGKPVPPEVQAVLAQAQSAMQQVQQQAQLVQQAAQEAETDKAQAEKAKADVQTAIANLQTEKAQFDAYVAQKIAQLQQKEFQQAAATMSGQRDQLYQEIAAAAQQFMAQAGEALSAVQGEQARLSDGVTQAIAAFMNGAPAPEQIQ